MISSLWKDIQIIKSQSFIIENFTYFTLSYLSFFNPTDIHIFFVLFALLGLL